jgi:hypothetical protein
MPVRNNILFNDLCNYCQIHALQWLLLSLIISLLVNYIQKPMCYFGFTCWYLNNFSNKLQQITKCLRLDLIVLTHCKHVSTSIWHDDIFLNLEVGDSVLSKALFLSLYRDKESSWKIFTWYHNVADQLFLYCDFCNCWLSIYFLTYPPLQSHIHTQSY